MLSIGAALMLALGAGGDEADRIDDRRFLELANARCAATEKAVVGPNRRPLDGAAEARRIDALATGWEAMVLDLRVLPVATADAPKVDRWLRAWDQWTAHGRDYADALRAKDKPAADEVLRASQAENTTMSRFALLNGMDDCLFRTS